METHDIHEGRSPDETALPANGENGHSDTSDDSNPQPPHPMPGRLSSAHTSAGCRLLPSLTACPLPDCKDKLDTKTLRRGLRWYSRLRTTSGWAVA